MTPSTENKDSNARRLEIVLLITGTLLCLVPFLGRAFNIDEPLFIWAAKQIQMHPLDFYGFRINWYNTGMSAAEIIKNPPLASYYLALVGGLAGWNEVPLHAAFLLPAVAAVAGTYLLAERFTKSPLAAGLLALLTPVFLLSSATVMCDTMMVAFYVWAVYLWMRGLKDGRSVDLALSGLLVAASSLTKYFGISLIPLLLVYTLASGREQRKKALFLLIPVALLALYQWGTQMYYGRGLLWDAAGYASRESTRGISGPLEGIAVGLSFTGGSFITCALIAARGWNRRVIAAAAVAIAAITMLTTWTDPTGVTRSWDYNFHFALFFAAGVTVLCAAGQDLWRRRDADTLLLVLWILGTFLFASVVNWSVNGRSILPMTPAVAIMAVRLFEERGGASGMAGVKGLALPLSCGLILSMAVTWGDFTLAGTARSAAATVAKEATGSASRLWFQGHWGFQYYIEEKGGEPYDVVSSRIEPGELMAVPENNCNLLQKVYNEGKDFRQFRFPQTGFASTNSLINGTGFYSSRIGALPYRLCLPGDEIYHLLSFDHTVNPT